MAVGEASRKVVGAVLRNEPRKLFLLLYRRPPHLGVGVQAQREQEQLAAEREAVRNRRRAHEKRGHKAHRLAHAEDVAARQAHGVHAAHHALPATLALAARARRRICVAGVVLAVDKLGVRARQQNELVEQRLGHAGKTNPGAVGAVNEQPAPPRPIRRRHVRLSDTVDLRVAHLLNLLGEGIERVGKLHQPRSLGRKRCLHALGLGHEEDDAIEDVRAHLDGKGGGVGAPWRPFAHSAANTPFPAKFLRRQRWHNTRRIYMPRARNETAKFSPRGPKVFSRPWRRADFSPTARLKRSTATNTTRARTP